MSGTFRSASGNTITFTDGTTHEVVVGAKIVLNWIPCSLDDLKPGDGVLLAGEPATAVSATR